MEKRKQLVLIAAISVINAIIILIIFSNQFFNTLDLESYNVRLILLIIIPLTAPLVYLGNFKGEFNIKKILLITFLVNFIIILVLVLFEIGVFPDVEIAYSDTAEHILNGDYSDPFSFGDEITWENEWRIYPPGSLIWFTFNYIIHGFNPFFWRLVNLCLMMGIIFFMYKIGLILKLKTDFLKNSIVLYVFSAIPFVFSILWAQSDCFTVFLCISGIYFILRGYNNGGKGGLEKQISGYYIYIGVALIMFASLVKIYALIWLFGYGIFLIKQKNWLFLFKVILVALFTAIIICLPFIIMNFDGFIANLLIFVTGVDIPKAPYYSIWYIPRQYGIFVTLPLWLIAIFVIYYVYKYKETVINLEFFTIIICIFIFFSAWNLAYVTTWFLPLIYLSLSKSSVKFRNAIIILYTFVYAWFLLLAFAGLFVPDGSTSVNYIFAVYLGMNLDIFNKIFINSILYVGILYIVYTLLRPKKGSGAQIEIDHL